MTQGEAAAGGGVTAAHEIGVLEGGAGPWPSGLAPGRRALAHRLRVHSAVMTKRTLDVVGSLVLLLVLMPVLLGTVALVKATSPGPVFYRQERIGRQGRSFRIVKFRSMTDGADGQLMAMLGAQGRGDAPLFKVDDDPRITRVGAIIRRYSIDELPQLINVLQGTMSLVGPRPQRPAEVAMYSPAERERLSVDPGLTGLWQVSGRSRLSWDEAVRLDVHYCRNWTLLMDLKILLRTIPAVFRADGAQ